MSLLLHWARHRSLDLKERREFRVPSQVGDLAFRRQWREREQVTVGELGPVNSEDHVTNTPDRCVRIESLSAASKAVGFDLEDVIVAAIEGVVRTCQALRATYDAQSLSK